MTMPSRWIWLVGAIWLWISPPAFGQSVDEHKRSQSHFPIPLQSGDFKSLSQRFSKLKEMDAVSKDPKEFEQQAKKIADLLKDSKNPNSLEKMKELAKDPIFKDQRFQDWLQGELNSHKGDFSPEQFKKLDETVKKLGESTENRLPGDSSGPGLPSPDKADDLGNRPSGPKADEVKGSEQASFGPKPGTPPSSSDRSNPEESLRRWLVDNFNPNKGPLADSQAFQDALRELRRTPFNMEPPGADAAGLPGKLARWSEGLTKSDVWSKVDWPSMKKWRLPSKGSLPKIQSPISAPSFGPAPNVSLPSATTLSRALQVLWIALIAAAGILVWKLLGGNIPGVGRLRKAGWRLGPWPVSPEGVASRQDVVRAFEYLSLLKLGPAVKSRNHIELAVELGRATGDTRRAANCLASVYEKARYTPADEPLSADALAAARKELCFLAGVKLS
jgi:hypothetical protein